MPEQPFALKTISPDGVVPETRFQDAVAAQDFAWRMTINDNQRSLKRSRVNGLVDGNPPYRASKLRELGRADAANFNTGEAKAFMDSAVGAFDDLSAEAASIFTIEVEHGTDEQREGWAGIIVEELDEIFRKNKLWKYNHAISHWEMVLHGCGPLMFEDAETPIPKAFHCGNLKVPEFTPSETEYWDAGAIVVTYYPPQLYKFIENEAAATALGWNVPYTKKVIAAAMNVIRANKQVIYDWEYLQAELKNNSWTYYDDSKVCKVACVFSKEFDGRVTFSMVQHVQMGTTVSGGDNSDKDSEPTQYLFFRHGRYRDFNEFVHPMYYDHGNGGYHHSVTGLGVKMYSLMEYKNRMVTNACDKAAAPKMMFAPANNETKQKFSMVTFGDYGIVPAGWQVQQAPVAGIINDVLGMNGELTSIAQSNLSAYRQQPMQKEGNPITAKQVMYEASQTSSLSRTPIERYYQQKDNLLQEVYRRMSNINSTNEIVKGFQNRCKKRGVPIEAIVRVKSVSATRAIGQGSAFMRVNALDNLWATIGMALPEDGQHNLINDQIAAKAGQALVKRYNPVAPTTRTTDQQAEATQWVAAMKVGVQPVVTSSQNPVTYAATWLNAAIGALQSIQQGANPMEVIQFVDVCAPAVMQQLARFAKDPTRKPLHDQLMQQFQQLAQATDKVKRRVMQQGKQQKQQQQKTQQVLSDADLAKLQLKSDIELKTAKVQASLQQSQERHQQQMVQAGQNLAINDAKAASQISIDAHKAKAAEAHKTD